ncbi:MAG: hypothetical protein ACUVTB_00820 [Candidatus Bathycorpusculaceae bacterium]
MLTKSLLRILLLILLILPTIHRVLAWEMERPSATVEGINVRIENCDTNYEAAVGVGVHVYGYRENASDPPYFGKDGFALRVIATANTKGGD